MVLTTIFRVTCACVRIARDRVSCECRCTSCCVLGIVSIKLAAVFGSSNSYIFIVSLIIINTYYNKAHKYSIVVYIFKFKFIFINLIKLINIYNRCLTILITTKHRPHHLLTDRLACYLYYHV